MSFATKNSVIQNTALFITFVFSIVMLNIINLGKKEKPRKQQSFLWK